jgi:hypothetical protein
MTDRSDALVQALFQKPTLQACSLQQVDYLAHQYPYFSVAQILLLQKTEPGSEAYSRQLHQVALHVSQPLRLQYWLQPDAFETESTQTQLFQNPIPDEIGLEPVEQPELTTAPEVADDPQQAIVEPAPLLPELETESDGIEENEVTIPGTDIEEPAEPVAAASQPLSETIDTPTPEPQAETIAAPAAEPGAPVITFEPFHTVDYFASQGIRLSQQEVGNDKLGRQLKSFTEWLRTMKRLPEVAAGPPGDATGERNVENLAAHSLDTADVVTESMAEVWLKQGNREKAADVYRKLSLHYPAKSAYFAAKIEALKQY